MGGIIGAVVGLMLITLLVAFLVFRAQRKKRMREEAFKAKASSGNSAAGLFDSAQQEDYLGFPKRSVKKS